jgi:hypothetical protein
MAAVRDTGLRLKFDYDGPPTAGAALVERLLATGKAPDGDLSSSEAAEAVAVLEQLQSLWFVDQMVEGGEMFAEQVHTKTAHGLQELVQNADDHGATGLRMAYRATSTGPQLLVAHDGKPVDLRDLVLMAYALLSGSRDDPEKIGRFGIGLKTLNQIAEQVSVHCLPFRGVEISGGHIRAVRAPAAIKGFWSPQNRETLFVLRLNKSAPDSRWFKKWLGEWDVSSLLFLRSLRSVALFDMRTRKVRAEQRLVIEKGPDRASLDIRGGDGAERLVLRDAAGSRRWTRYTVQYPTPQHLRRTHKATGDSLPLAVAIPERGASQGRLFAGLPLDEPSRLPFSLAAPFDINVSRTEIREQRSGFNEWLVDRLGDLIVAVGLERFARNPSSGWRAVPLTDETAGEETSWLDEQVSGVIESVHARLASKLRLKVAADRFLRPSEIVFEAHELDGLLSPADLVSLDDEERQPLPKRSQEGGRWRDALWELGATRVDATDAVELLEGDGADGRGAKWLVDFAAAVIRSDAGDELWERRWVVLAGSDERLSPSDISERRVLLVHGGGKKGLAAGLKQDRPLARAFVARNRAAERVRKWLTEKAVLRRNPTDEDALRALARGDGSDPVDLRQDRKLLLRLRDAFTDLALEDRQALGRGIGKNVLLRGYAFRGGKRISVPVVPAASYLPSSIEKHEGWLRAAGRCEGIKWVHGDYAETLRLPAGSRKLGALAFLRAIGAGVSPHLVPIGDEDEQLWISEAELSEHQLEQLSDFPTADYLLNDWASPDLESVIADIIKDPKAVSRRARARALFLALHNNWREYAERADVVVARWHRREHRLGKVSASWVGRAASAPWLTTRAKGLNPKAPRELLIDTGAAFGDVDANQYADEIEPQYAESPAAAALGLRGQFSEEDLIDVLEQLRTREKAGEGDGRHASQIYAALASYRHGDNAARRELTARQLQARFGRPSAKEGLVRASNGSWLPPAQVRRGPFLDERLPSVTGAEALWAELGIPQPDIRDCVRLLGQLADEKAPKSPSEFRIFEHLLDIAPRQRAGRNELRAVPLRTKHGWRRPRPIFAVANPAMAGALADKLSIWDAPMPIERLAPLLKLLNVDVVDEATFEPKIDSAAYAGGEVLRSPWLRVVAHFREFLTIHRPDLGEALDSAGWGRLASAVLALGPSWSIRVLRPGKTAVTVMVPAFLFRTDPMIFAAFGEDYAEGLDYGGQAIASAFGNVSGSDRVFLAMAWETAFRRRQDEPSGIFDSDEDDEPASEGVDLSSLPVRPGRTGKKRARRPTSTGKEPKLTVRELVDPDELNLATLEVHEAGTERKGKMRITSRRPLKPAGPSRKTKKRAPREQKTYGPQDREDVGYRLMERWLERRGIHLEDTRNQKNVGADGVDLDQDLYFELKAHARDPDDAERLESSEAQLAKIKKDRYWLVIAWGLEKNLKQELLFIQNPLAKLDTIPTGGTRVSGILSVRGQAPRARKKRG